MPHVGSLRVIFLLDLLYRFVDLADVSPCFRLVDVVTGEWEQLGKLASVVAAEDTHVESFAPGIHNDVCELLAHVVRSLALQGKHLNESERLEVGYQGSGLVEESYIDLQLLAYLHWWGHEVDAGLCLFGL